MTPCDSMAIAIEWLDAYRSARVDQMVALHSPDAVIDCACVSGRVIQGKKNIATYWRHRFAESPALELVDLQADGEAVVITFRTGGGIVETLLDIAEDGRINCCACGLEQRIDR